MKSNFTDKFSKETARKSAEKTKDMGAIPKSYGHITQLNVMEDMRHLQIADNVK